MYDNINNEGIEPLIFDTPEMRSKFINPQKNDNNGIKAMDFDVRTKSFEEKVYIILYKLNTSEDDDIHKNIYTVCVGRTMAYNDIKEKLISGLDIDIHRSLVMTETKQTETETGDRKYYMLPYDELISLYSFCISISNYYDDEFDIEDYNEGDVPEDDSSANIANGNFLTPEQIAYRELLEQSMRRGKFIGNMRDELSQLEGHNI